ncbi:sensor histidine kinase [Paenibacillus cremeus]|uniref:histidine kinase n=1 Tax=Paenibacillus cremeus TaxID=2163881 RepID=A0A559KDA7_9BACL|nr:sensor histidine kinase [Paenibacillus cremeus]TVY10095.1 sensor histidine kinase [Paenibacillus cremeus]
MLRLLIYLGIICLLIFSGTAALLYWQSVSAAREQEEKQARLWHEQASQRIEQSMGELDRMVKTLSGDWAVRRFAETGLSRESAEEAALRDYLDALIKQQAQQWSYINELCLTQDSTGLSLCNQPAAGGKSLASRRLPALSRNERLLLPVTTDSMEENAREHELIYAAPLFERGTSIVKGTLTLSLNASKLLKDAVSDRVFRRFAVIDEQGQLIYGLEPSATKAEVWAAAGERKGEFQQWDSGRYISQKRLGIPYVSWYSRAELIPAHSFADRNRVVLLLLLFTLVLALLFTASAFLYKRLYMTPVAQLRGLMKRAELGDLKAYWVSKHGNGLQELGESYNQMLNRLEELIKQVKREEALKKEAEMEALQYQLNPHFLYNTLNTIKWVAKLHKTPQISEAVTALVRLLQASLGKKGDFITVREEIGLLQDYMEIQRFRYGDKIQLICEMEPASKECLLPCMLLQPLVENAIVHGIEPGKREGRIAVRIHVDVSRGLLLCEVEDNGVGMTESAQGTMELEPPAGPRVRERMTGIGLKHIREKIRLYYGSGYNMHIVSKPGEGTTIRLTLPMHQSGG